MYLLGLDIGSSSVKASLLDAETNMPLHTVQSPATELPIDAPLEGWAEQDPGLWWEHVRKAIAKLGQESGHDLSGVAAIGIAYQMHGLVLVDKKGEVLRPAIIWCDSRAVDTGERIARNGNADRMFGCLLNLPGNLTAAKLAWVARNEAELFRKASAMMLPGDYIAMKLTGEVNTTPGGLSEGTLWDYSTNEPANWLLDDIVDRSDLIPRVVNNIEVSGYLSPDVAGELGLSAGVPVSYRAGDQPNNALSLGVFKPGQVAGTGGYERCNLRCY